MRHQRSRRQSRRQLHPWRLQLRQLHPRPCRRSHPLQAMTRRASAQISTTMSRRFRRSQQGSELCLVRPTTHKDSLRRHPSAQAEAGEGRRTRRARKTARRRKPIVEAIDVNQQCWVLLKNYCPSEAGSAAALPWMTGARLAVVSLEVSPFTVTRSYSRRGHNNECSCSRIGSSGALATRLACSSLTCASVDESSRTRSPFVRAARVELKSVRREARSSTQVSCVRTQSARRAVKFMLGVVAAGRQRHRGGHRRRRPARARSAASVSQHPICRRSMSPCCQTR